MRLTRFATIQSPAPAWPTWVGAAHRRRLDPLTRIACAAVDGLHMTCAWSPDTALVVSTAYGSIDSTWRFASSIAEFGDAGASPTPFTSSVHNASSGSLSELLHLHGSCTTLSQGGHATIAALRWADLQLTSQRAPAVLIVIADHFNAWSRNIVSSLSGSPWPLGDGAVALLAEPGDGAGRVVRWGDHAYDLAIDAGAPHPADEALLAVAPRRRSSADIIGAWAPGSTLAGVTSELWRSTTTLQIRECEDRILHTAWLGPWC